MKRIILLAAAALIACGAVAQTNETYPSYVQVTGSAEREIEPDEFYLAVTINERDSKGKISIEQQQREMVAALKKLGGRCRRTAQGLGPLERVLQAQDIGRNGPV